MLRAVKLNGTHVPQSDAPVGQYMSEDIYQQTYDRESYKLVDLLRQYFVYMSFDEAGEAQSFFKEMTSKGYPSLASCTSRQLRSVLEILDELFPHLEYDDFDTVREYKAVLESLVSRATQ